MVTTRQFGRGVTRTMRAIDRQAKQAERQRVARQNVLAKQAMLDASAQAAAEYDAVIDALTAAHRVGFARRDWLTDATAPLLDVPERSSAEEQAAEDALATYEPGWFVRSFGLTERRRAALAAAIDHARARDDADHAERQGAVEAANARIRFAQRVTERDRDAVLEALETHSALGRLPFSVEAAELLFTGDGRIVAVIDGLDLEDMPDETVTLLQSGKASIKAMASGKRLELHRDALCSAAIRVAIEILAALPLDEIEVVLLTDILDRGSGHIAGEPVLYLRVTAQALQAVNLTRAEALALVERLGGHMAWNKRDGFRAINLGAFGVDFDA